MKKKRDLLSELNIIGQPKEENCPMYIDREKIKSMVNNRTRSAYQERKISVMKSKKKVALIAVAAVLILGITALGGGGIISTWYSGSSANPEYKSLPSAEQCIKDIGYVPELIDSFENGYAFKNGSIVNNVLEGEDGNTVAKFKSVTFRYEKDGDSVSFSQDKFHPAMEISGDVVAKAGDVDIYYYSYMNKVVPPDYELTEEDKKAEESGELVFSYGNVQAGIDKVQNVSWVKDGIYHGLMQIDGNLSQEELTEMAKEILEN